MKKTIVFLVVAALVFVYVQEQEISPPWSLAPTANDNALEDAYKNGQSDIQVRGQGTVVEILRDDLDGSRHQRFILKLDSGQTVLISHNIDLAPRVDALRAGHTVEFFGEYEWNPKGGVVHWTHHDPNGRHVAGWLKHQGRTYQ
jgi:hypothetical protein